MNKRQATSGGTCYRCKTFVRPSNGWVVKVDGSGWVHFHNGCFNSEVEDNKSKLKKAFEKIDKDLGLKRD